MRFKKEEILKVVEALLKEAGEDGKIRSKIKTGTKTAVDQDVDDILNGIDDIEVSDIDVSKKKKTDQEEDVARGDGNTFDDFGDLDDLDGIIDDILGQEARDGDFDQEFEAAAKAKPSNFARSRRNGHQGENEFNPEFEAGVGNPGSPETKRFQTNQPAKIDEPGLVGKTKGDPSAQIEKVLMDEFVIPAMSVGANVLPAVWSEIIRLSKQPGFGAAFHIALNGIRSDEDHWFANLLDVDITTKHAPAPQESNELVERLRHVLSRYYDLVLKQAGKNSGNLSRKLYAIKSKYDDESFRSGFMKAIQKSRDMEDAAFGVYLGSTAGNKLKLKEGTELHRSYNSCIKESKNGRKNNGRSQNNKRSLR